MTDPNEPIEDPEAPAGGHWRRPTARGLKADVVAAVPRAIGGVPDGMAAGLLAGVNPVQGLYASLVGPIVGGASVSTELMVVTTTSAAALAAGSTLDGFGAGDRPGAMVALTLVAGILMVVAGALRLGRATRFVSHSVMVGFLAGVAVNIIAGQLPHLLGAVSTGEVAIARGASVLVHPGRIDAAATACGLGALAILLVLSRTRLSPYAALAAIVVPSVVVAVTGADVVLVGDANPIPPGLPIPELPALRLLLNPDILVGGLAVAAIVLVQGAGVSDSAPNPDDSLTDTNRDFVGQGLANIATGIFRGQPVGGSVGQTALNRVSGARSRWASIFSGLFVALILVALSAAVEAVADPTLAAVLVFAAARSLKASEFLTILRASPSGLVAAGTTFVAILILPVAAAVGIGVALSLLLQLNRDAMDLSVVELVPEPDGTLLERPAPERVRSNDVLVLDVYGSLLYAGARTLEARLPSMVGAVDPVVVLRMRGRTSLGATFFVVVGDYARRLHDVGGTLLLSGLDSDVAERFRAVRSTRHDMDVKLVEATPVLGESTTEAVQLGRRWLVQRSSIAEG